MSISIQISKNLQRSDTQYIKMAKFKHAFNLLVGLYLITRSKVYLIDYQADMLNRHHKELVTICLQHKDTFAIFNRKHEEWTGPVSPVAKCKITSITSRVLIQPKNNLIRDQLVASWMVQLDLGLGHSRQCLNLDKFTERQYNNSLLQLTAILS